MLLWLPPWLALNLWVEAHSGKPKCYASEPVTVIQVIRPCCLPGPVAWPSKCFESPWARGRHRWSPSLKSCRQWHKKYPQFCSIYSRISFLPSFQHQIAIDVIISVWYVDIKDWDQGVSSRVYGLVGQWLALLSGTKTWDYCLMNVTKTSKIYFSRKVQNQGKKKPRCFLKLFVLIWLSGMLKWKLSLDTLEYNWQQSCSKCCLRISIIIINAQSDFKNALVFVKSNGSFGFQMNWHKNYWQYRNLCNLFLKYVPRFEICTSIMEPSYFKILPPFWFFLNPLKAV